MLFVTGLLILGFGLELAMTYFDTSHHGTQSSIERVEADPTVELERLGAGYVVRPAEGDSSVGLVFYPGGRVHPDAYLDSLSPLASRANVTVFIPKMPMNLAVFGQGAAGPVVRDHPDIDRWYVGGHSLGGAMACRYANGHADRIDGVVLLASYCDRNLSDASLRVLSVTGTADRVLNRDQYQASRSNFPRDTTDVRIRGMNHSEFGSYTGQRGGAKADISFSTAHDRLGDVLVRWVQNGTKMRDIRDDSQRLSSIVAAVNLSPTRHSTPGDGRHVGIGRRIIEIQPVAGVRGHRARNLGSRGGLSNITTGSRRSSPVRWQHRRYPRRIGPRW